jgi:hypothetical protein
VAKHSSARLSRGLLIATSALAGAAAAVLVIAVFDWPAAPRATAVQLPKASLKTNKQPLSQAQAATLLRWAARYRSCAGRRGLRLAPPKLGEDEVLLAATHSARIERRELERGLSCAGELGDPPPFTSFVLARDRRLHLYKPRTCLLPVVPKKAT